ncbi:hypothetical protein [Sphingorhabdus sp. 109]|jgi:hypothetical protein|uniref:hypothetical protein n=1 Tax=Sphingorhabdus sp. 109 TaxID=2653173 RepID=UPI0012F3C968|nr:hypothetical protein [Sphingorhabdus sp. 109]VWX58335.1 conserved hypothetical protein [Sphingorhabdus sp. 109]
MTFSLIAMPAVEELAMDHFAPDSIRHKQRDSGAFHKIAGLYLLMLLLIFQFPSGAGSADAQASAAETVAPAQFPSEECIQPPLSPHQIED